MHFITFLIKNLVRRKVRSLLTCLGVAVSVGTTVALLGLSDSFQRQSLYAFTGRSVDAVVVEADKPNQLSSELPDTVGKEIEKIPEVESTAGAILEIESIPRPNDQGPITVVVQGWEPESFLLEGIEILDGRKIKNEDVLQVMIGETISNLLEKKVGDELLISDVSHEIVGVFKSFSIQENRCAIVTLKQMQELYFKEGIVTGLSIRLKNKDASDEEVKAICNKVAQLQDENGTNLGLFAEPTSDYINNAMHIRAAIGMAWITSMIAIVVGAIGMLNTMIMSVVERVKEIAILRAIGWRKSRIVKMIVGESLLISLMGSILGTVVAVGFVRWLAGLPEVSDYLSREISWPVYVTGFAIAGMVGLFGGLYPALRAAYMMPSEGLRHG